VNQKEFYYGLAGFDRTHIVNINWIYDLPRLSPHWNNVLTRTAFDNWQYSGIASFVSGAPLAVNFSTTDGADITGSPTETPRPDLVANAVIPKSQRTIQKFFNTAAFARPAKGTLGSAPKYDLRGPGINDLDMALYKNFLIKEGIRMQFRWETYNTLNHTQFATLNTTARFDPLGNQVNAQFGQVISSRQPRRMQLALKFIF
jgi:hypothetical protein